MGRASAAPLLMLTNLIIKSMSNEQAKKSLGADLKDGENKKDPSKRKMTQAILDDQEKQKETYEFLEEDDDFEEFEVDFSERMDVEMGQGADADKQLWRQDWDDEQTEEDFEAQLRQQLAKAK